MNYQPEIIEPTKFIKTFADVEKECFAVKVEGKDYEVCSKTSSNYWANTKPGSYGKGLISGKDDKYRPVRSGLLGEIALAKTFGLSVDVSYKEGGDKADGLFNKYSYDIKTATYDYGAALIYHTNEWGKKVPLNKDIYISAYITSDDRENEVAEVIIVGFMLKEDVFKCEVRRGRRGNGHLNYEVPHHKTKSIVKLHEYVQQNTREYHN